MKPRQVHTPQYQPKPPTTTYTLLPYCVGLSEQQREMALIFDEINVCGELAFKVVNGEYHFFGLVDDELRSRLFGTTQDVDIKEQLTQQVASHALVFQVALYRGKK